MTVHGGEVVEQRDDADDDRPERRADQRHEVEQEDDHRQRAGVRHAEDQQHDVGEHPCDERLAERAGHVVADGVADPVEQPVQPLLPSGALARRDPVQPVASRADHEQAEHEDRDAGEDRVHQPESDVGQDPRRIADAPGEGARLLLQLGGDVVVLFELSQAVVLPDEVLQVGDVAREVVDQVVELLDDRRDQQRAQHDRDQDQRDVDDRDREPAAHAALQEVHRARQGDGEEAGDEDPGQRPAQQVDQVQREHDGDHDEHDAQDRAHGDHRSRAAGDDRARGGRHRGPLLAPRRAPAWRPSARQPGPSSWSCRSAVTPIRPGPGVRADHRSISDTNSGGRP